MKKITFLTSLFIFIDLFSKFLVQNFLKSDIAIIENFFNIRYAENYGIAFSLQLPFYLIFILNISILAFFVLYIKKEVYLEKIISVLSVSLVISGGIANLIDRAMNGFVVDFISIHKYPIFNLADIFISLGVLFLIVFYGKIFKNQSNKNVRNK
jgi:signal peptidase II